mmetsp:Transcript_18110/g.20947  ORF Transcript_18110/g.20947 Transcript_18110/m.20947 type:complete len:402 (+) Transcript_18110:224-1429(+)
MKTPFISLTFSFIVISTCSYRAHAFSQMTMKERNPGKKPNFNKQNSRRNFLTKSTISIVGISTAITTLIPQPSNAGEVGAKINKAVTQSDLGISVRKSVVKGAQLIDNLDAKWEKFSDENALGSERYKQQPRPTAKVIPDPAPLNTEVAKFVLKASDEAFLETLDSSMISDANLKSQNEKVDKLVRKSFERSGLNLGDVTETSPWTSQQFNYYCYTHFKSMCDILIENKLPFDRKKFEVLLGNKLLPLFVTPASLDLISTAKNQSLSKNERMKAFDAGLKLTDEIIANLVVYGFVAAAERNNIENEEEKVSDWADDLSDLQLSIPLDGDITLNSQILLQEQGFRLYPDFGRFAITSGLQQSLQGTKQVITADEYYMDTNYSTDPDLFEVKQVLVNIVIDSA